MNEENTQLKKHKTCTNCGISKPLDEFHNEKSSKEGY